MINPYKILGVTPNMSDAEIKKAYRTLAKQNHPDVSGDDSTYKMALINEAYGMIKTKDLRDKLEKEMAFSNDFGLWSTLFGKSDIAKNFGKPPIDKKLQKRGKDIRKTIDMPEEDIVRPHQVNLIYKRKTSCYNCSGTGSSKFRKCIKCGGTGKFRTIERTPDGYNKDVLIKCDVCKGTRLESIETCSICKGTGFSTKTMNISFMHDGNEREYTFIGKGHSGKNNGENGNLIITLRSKDK